MSERFNNDTQPILSESIPPHLGPRMESPVPERLNSLPILKKFTTSLRAACDDGWIPHDALSHQGRLMFADVYATDTPIDLDDRTEQGFIYDHKTRELDASYSIFVPAKEFGDKKVVYREFLRVMSGDELTTDKVNRAGNPVRRKGLEQVFGDNAGGRAMNRVIVEHLADGLANGAFNSYDAANPAQKRAKHRGESALLHVLKTCGTQPVDVRLFSDAFFEDDAASSKLGDKSARAFLTDALERAFPFTDVIQEISELQPLKGQSVQQVIAKYAADLEKRATRPQRLSSRLASMATNHLMKRRLIGDKAVRAVKV